MELLTQNVTGVVVAGFELNELAQVQRLAAFDQQRCWWRGFDPNTNNQVIIILLCAAPCALKARALEGQMNL